MADLSNVINVALLAEGKAVARDNMNVVSIFTSSTVLSSTERYRLYSNAAAVSEDFGASSEEAAFANVFFGTSPNPVNAGGVLVMAFWRAVDEDVDATAGKVTGNELVESAVVSSAQAISDGTGDIDVDGVTVNLTALDFQTSTTLDEIAAILNTAIAGASVAVVNDRLVVTSDTTGVTSLVTVMTDPGTGTFIGSLFGLTAPSGASVVDGAAAETLSAEEKIDSLAAVKGLVNFKGYMFIDNVLDSEVPTLASWGQANSVLAYDVFSAASNLEIDVTNPVWVVKLSGQTTYRMLYSAAGNRQFAATYMARMHTVNFNAINSALTMHLKELTVPAEEYSQTVINKAQAVGLDLYTTFKNVPKVFTSGANDFTDNPYNLIAFIDAVQSDTFNVLGTTPTKIPQTLPGMNTLVDSVEQTAQGFVTAGVFAPGTWSSPDSFGDLDTFLRNVSERGYYVLAGDLATQPTADRQARKSTVIQTAVKNAGAIHQVDVIINFNL